MVLSQGQKRKRLQSEARVYRDGGGGGGRSDDGFGKTDDQPENPCGKVGKNKGWQTDGNRRTALMKKELGKKMFRRRNSPWHEGG